MNGPTDLVSKLERLKQPLSISVMARTMVIARTTRGDVSQHLVLHEHWLHVWLFFL